MHGINAHASKIPYCVNVVSQSHMVIGYQIASNLLAGSDALLQPPNGPLNVRIMLWNFTYIFQTYIWTVWHTSNVPHPCALTFEYIAQIACKKGHFVSAERFNVWCNQRVGFGHFFSTKLSGCHIDTLLSSFEHSDVELGPFEKITFFPPDPLLPRGFMLHIWSTLVLI